MNKARALLKKWRTDLASRELTDKIAVLTASVLQRDDEAAVAECAKLVDLILSMSDATPASDRNHLVQRMLALLVSFQQSFLARSERVVTGWMTVITAILQVCE